MIKPLKLAAVSVSILMLVVAACSQHETKLDKLSMLKINNLTQPEDMIFSSGQPSKEDLDEIAKLGIKHVINLRPQQEQEWDEEAYVHSLGMRYHSIAVSGAEDITFDNASFLTAVLNEAKDEPKLVHCASSNRVGALIALKEFKQNGQDIEAAIAQGKRWGMTSLEADVRTKLADKK